MSNSITSNKNLVIQTYNTADGTLPTTAVTTSGLTSGTTYTTWDVPENYNEAALDLILGGVATVSVTGASGTVALTADKYQPMALVFTGTLTANVTYTIPSGVGGTWIMRNSTTGSYTITIQSLTSGASATLAVPQDGNPYVATVLAVTGGGVYLNSIPDGTITTAKIADSAVTTAKIADSAITTAKLVDYSLTNTKLLPSVIDGLTAKTTLASGDEFSIYDSAAVLTISGFTFSGSGPTYTATATTSTAHGYTTGNSVTISGATGNTSVNGIFTITVTSTTQFTITVTSNSSVTNTPSVIQNPGLKKITWANVQSQLPGKRLINTRIITTSNLSISGFTFSGAGPYTATATTSTAHGLLTGDYVAISGGTGNTTVNGTFTITVISTTQFTYSVTSNASVTGSPVVAIGKGTYGSAGSITPTTGTTYIIVKGVGGGGGGGYAKGTAGNATGCPSGGGGGAFDAVGIGIDLTVGPITSIPYSIGAAGSGGIGSSTTAATAGGATTFGTTGSYLNLGGGAAGVDITTGGGAASIGAAGGTVITGSSGASGGYPGANGAGSPNLFNFSGGGGSSPWGGGGKGAGGSSAPNSVAGASATGHGAGGGGASATNSNTANGGNGSGGLLIIEEYVSA